MLDTSRRNDTHGARDAPCADAAPGPCGDHEARELELFARFPLLATLGRVGFGAFPTPVERVPLPGVRGALWMKRDDLNASRLAETEARCAGGNKLRALEFLLGRVQRGDTVITFGGDGSTHVLATVALARRLGARTIAIRWRHEMNEIARQVDRRTRELADHVQSEGDAVRAIVRGWFASRRARGRGTVWRIPPGGASPAGMLGAVNAGLELAAQVARGEAPAPAYVVLPLGTGGTAAGLALGFAIAGLETEVVGVRVVPRVVSNRWRVLALAHRCARLIERTTGTRVPRVRRRAVRVLHRYYGGAYGRPLGAAREVRGLLQRATGVILDETYGAKAFAAAMDLAQTTDATILYWLTFDARSVSDGAHTAHAGASEEGRHQ
ncbi:MAG TPA: pyridoxal-phosphate dependent enzyme [Gemmatimonadaceae bacterium]|nr:pyridoxal-phosphate dependent enzyme [Gemmatimonadaceae bacterium]